MRSYEGAENQYCVWLSCYEQRRISEIGPEGYRVEADTYASPLHYPLARNACDTVQAEIAGRQKPKPMFMPTGADWAVRRKSKRLDRFVESVLRQPQGQYANAWELTEDVMHDATVGGYGIMRVLAGDDSIIMERFPRTVRVYVDPREAQFGRPRNWFIRYPMDRDIALKKFVEDATDVEETELELRRMAIEGARNWDQMPTDLSPVADQIEVTEAYLVAIDRDTPGTRSIAINGELMLDEAYERTYAPVIIYRWARQKDGFWGTGLVEEGYAMQSEVNEQAQKLQRRHRLCGIRRTFLEPDSLLNPKLLQGNEDDQIIYKKPGTATPEIQQVPAVTPADVDYLAMNIEYFYQFTGVPQALAAGRKEQDVVSGVAIRAANNLAAARFAIKAKSYENMFVTIGRHIIDCAREVAARHKGFKLPFPGKEFHGEIRWQDVDMGDDMFVIHVAPSSSLPNDPEGRLATASDLLNMGVIDKRMFANIYDSPDIEQFMDAENAERSFVEWTVDRILDQGVFEDGARSLSDIVHPDTYLTNKEGALLVASQAYFTAVRQGAPEKNLSLMRAFMTLLAAQIKLAQQAAMAAQNPQQAMAAAPQVVTSPGPQGAPAAMPAPPQAA